MASISLSINRGNDGFSISSFTIGTQVPAANDVELRFNTTDANSAVLTRKDVIQALLAFQRAIESGPLFVTTPVL